MGLAGLSWSRIKAGGWWGGVGGCGCIVIAEFGVKGLHFLHSNIVGSTQLELVHRGRWVEVDIVGEWLGWRVRAIHWRIISWLRCGVRRAALLKRSMNALSGSPCSCLAPHRLDVIPWILLRGVPGGASTKGRNSTGGRGVA